MRASTHTFVAFVDIEKAFDTSWVEATLVRLYVIGVRGLVWKLLSNFLRHTVSQVRLGNELSDQWLDSGIAQGRVLSPLLFDLLVDGLAAEVQLASPGVLLPGNFQCRFTDQLNADDLVLVADSPLDLQTALNAVHRWGCRFRFKFGVGPTKSAVMVPDGVSQTLISIWVGKVCQWCRHTCTWVSSSPPHFPGPSTCSS